MDKIIRAVTSDGFAKISVVTARASVERARVIHGASPTAAAALGRSLCAVSMLGEMLKEDDASVTLRINGGGGLGSVITVADSSGNMRGWAQNPAFDLPTRADGKLDVGGAVGKNGLLTVSRDFGYGEPYVGSTELVSGEIAEDITRYLSESEQIGAACGLGVLIDTDKTVRAAGGFIVQLMPGAPDSVALALEENIRAMGPVTGVLDGGEAEDIVSDVLRGLGPEILAEAPVEYRCYCSRERVERALSSIGEAGLHEMLESGETGEVKCQFCDAAYVFTDAELERLIGDIS